MTPPDLPRAADALVVVGDWISEYYFTTDAKESFQAKVAKRRTAWDAEEQPTARSRFTAARIDLETRLAALYDQPPGAEDTEATARLYADVREILGYATGQFTVAARGPARRYGTPGVVGSPLVVVEARPMQTVEELTDRHAHTLLRPYPLDDSGDQGTDERGTDERGTDQRDAGEQEVGEQVRSVAALLSRLFLADDGPVFALVRQRGPRRPAVGGPAHGRGHFKLVPPRHRQSRSVAPCTR